MKSWWFHLSLHYKIQIPIQLLLLLVLIFTQIWVEQKFKNNLFESAETRAIDSATQTLLVLNTMSLNGSISDPKSRHILFQRMSAQNGVEDFHLVRSKALQAEFGEGLPEEQARDELDLKALSTSQTQTQYLTEYDHAAQDFPRKNLRVVVPSVATHDSHGIDCLQCHIVPEYTVIGAVSMTVNLEQEYEKLTRLSTLLISGQILLQVFLFFLIGFLIRKSIATVLKLERTIQSIKTDGDLNKQVEVESDDEVGHIASAFNGFIQYMGELKSQLADKIAVLENYHDRIEQEQKVAVRYMDKLIAADRLQDAAVQFYLKPAENFSGDLIAFARTPDGRLHLLLADSTGHGLSAALAAMPMIHPFYSMTSKGFAISAIADEINKKIWESLPISHFVAAILASVDTVAQSVEIWCGGCPPLMLDHKGSCVHQFKSRHLAMGILPQEQFDASVEYFSYEENGGSLVMFSDGVIELENEKGEPFGSEHLLKTLHVANASARWKQVTQEIERYFGNKTSGNDDIALLMVQCDSSKKLSRRKSRHETPAPQNIEGQVVWQFSLTLGMQRLRGLDVVPLLLDIVQQIEKNQERGGEIFMILSEMFNNALDHGVLKLDSTLKHHEDGMERYFDERAARLAQTETGQIQLNLEKILNTDGSAFLRIRVSDSGDGFDFHNTLNQPISLNQRHGRGLALLNQVCRKVQFLQGGTEILVEFDLTGENDISA